MATELARDCCICIIPDFRPVNLLPAPTVVVSYVFYRTSSDALKSVCKHPVKSLLVICLQFFASNYNNDNSARLLSESVEPGEQKKLELMTFWVVTEESQKPFSEPGY